MLNYGAGNERSYNGAMKGQGIAGEMIVLAWLRQLESVSSVEDLRNVQRFQDVDVDVRVHKSNGGIVLGEIKTDSHISENGNFCFEMMRINHTAPTEFAGVLGWSARSEAQHLFVLNPNTNSLYLFRMDDVRKAFQDFTAEARPSVGGWMEDLPNLNMRWVSTDAIKSTLVMMIPMKVISYKPYDLSHVAKELKRGKEKP